MKKILDFLAVAVLCGVGITAILGLMWEMIYIFPPIFGVVMAAVALSVIWTSHRDL